MAQVGANQTESAVAPGGGYARAGPQRIDPGGMRLPTPYPTPAPLDPNTEGPVEKSSEKIIFTTAPLGHSDCELEHYPDFGGELKSRRPNRCLSATKTVRLNSLSSALAYSG